jgi:hypothetical protein
VNKRGLTAKQKKSALEYPMFLQEKRDGSIKGRACADVRKQREGSTKTDATSPTVALKSVLITATIDAFDKREVSIIDVPGAYLTADMDEEVFMCLRGKLAELMVKTAPKIYRKYVYVGSDNTPVLYVKLKRALYRCLRSALLFYLKLLKDLEVNGFNLNPYNPCVANKTVNGKQFTITWHVDDLKLSHVDTNEVDKTIKWFKIIYGEDTRVSQGKKHHYLGMDLDYSVPGEVKVTMVDYLKRVITEFPEIISGGATSPAADRLFTVRPEEEGKPLKERRTIAFHHCVTQLLFASDRAMKDIQPAVAFLTTRVRNPDEDNWLKLKRLLKYIRSTIHLPLILTAHSLNVIKWWVDASFTTHDNFRANIGVTMSLGKGSVIGMSKKQKTTLGARRKPSW